MQNKKIKISEVGLFLLILLAVLFSLILTFSLLNKSKEKCVKQQVTCCPCQMGGEERCMLESEAKIWREKLENCSENLFCLAVYNCKATKCKYENGKCVEVEIK